MRNPGFTAAAILLASLLAGCGSTVDTGDSPTDPGDATLLVRSTPAGAAILVDGQPTGRVTPADVSTFAQTQESVVTLTLAGYHPWHGLARKVEEMTLTLDATLTPSSAGTGAIQLQSDPPGATVFLDNQQTAYTTPGTIQNVPASQHVVEYRHAGFYPFREEVTVTPGRTASSAPVLTRLGQGRITGRVLDDQGNGVVGAQVGVRGLEVSTTTTVFGIFVLPNVPQGTYTLDAALATGDTALIGSRPDVTVIAGVPTNSADIVMSRGGEAGTITGRVVDMAGRPIEGAELFASVAVAPGFLPDSTVAPQRATTNANGRYSLNALATGFWVITAAYPGYATVTRGISPQIYLSANGTATVDFQLPASSADTPHPPRQLGALAFTFPTTMTRSPAAYEAIRDRILRRAWGSRYEKLRAQRQSVRGRSAPAGSLIEVDLSWSAPGDPDIIGYYIGRSPRENTGYQLQDDLLNPHAGLWIDYDERLSPNTTYYYRATAVNSKGLHSDPSNTAQASPLGQIQARSPIGQAASAAPRFEWDPLPGAFAYDVQVFANYPDRFVDPLWEAGSLAASGTSVDYTGPMLQPGHTYYWVVLARNSGDPETITGWSISRIAPFTIP